MRMPTQDAWRSGALSERHRLLVRSLLLTVVIAVVAAVAGTTDFRGVRWIPHLSAHLRVHARKPQAPAPSYVLHHAEHGGNLKLPVALIGWILAAILFALVLALVWRWWTGRPSAPAKNVDAPQVDFAQDTPPMPEPDPQPDPEQLLTGIEAALRTLDVARVPADAVVRAWLGLEQTAEESGVVRAPAETPTEFTGRILKTALADDHALQTLLRLYLRTRFGDHPVSAKDVLEVRAALQDLLATWQAQAHPAA
ncbi:MAG: DUF4129 domain-containing protein [Solirubrobacteraceae bacterium]